MPNQYDYDWQEDLENGTAWEEVPEDDQQDDDSTDS